MSQPRPPAVPLRRALIALAAVPVLVAWAGCSSAPPRKGGLSPEQKAALRELGFSETREGWELSIDARLVFAVDKADLNTDDLATLSRVAKVLRGIGIQRLTVDGHTDNQGATDYNRRLSERRAAVVADALMANGFAPSDIVRHAYGSTRPIADNDTEEGRRQNRRAVLIVPSP